MSLLAPQGGKTPGRPPGYEAARGRRATDRSEAVLMVERGTDVVWREARSRHGAGYLEPELGILCGLGGWVCAWPRAAPIPPRPIPNRVVPGASAGKYCAGNRVGGEAAARTPRPPTLACSDGAGWSSGSSLGS